MAPVTKSPSGLCHIRVSGLDGISVTKEQENHLRHFRLLLIKYHLLLHNISFLLILGRMET